MIEYDSELQDFEYIPISYKKLESLEMTDLIIDSLSNLNAKLTEIEFKLKKEILERLEHINRKVKDDSDWINDHSIDAEITFYLKEGDPDFIEEESDNIMTVLHESFYIDKNWEYGICDGVNHNTRNFCKRISEEKEEEEFHCWIYHGLYDHTRLSLIDLARIGSFDVDINVLYQTGMINL